MPRINAHDPRAAVRMVWSDLLFLHWPVPAEILRPLVPAALEIDEHGGRAWVGLIPFSMPLVRPWWLPRPLHVRGISAFDECNVRTYVRAGMESGVYFFSLDASSPPAVWAARRFWHLPYHRARIRRRRDGDVQHYELRRGDGTAALRCSWRVGEPLVATRPGDLAHFLTERYSLFCMHRGRGLLRGPIAHDPWPLRTAELIDLDDTLVQAAGIEVHGPPLAHAAERLDVIAQRLTASPLTPARRP